MDLPLSCTGDTIIGGANILTGEILMRTSIKVLPCREGNPSAKAPYPKKGFHAATADHAQRLRWSRKYPYAVWGLPCALNGTLVLDADRHGNGDGVANLVALFEQHKFDWRSVPIVATPNGGYHVYFNRPTGLGPTRATLCQAVDIRDNAYVIAPGCKMLDGREYQLVSGNLEQFAESLCMRRLPDPPDWMMSLLVHPPMSRRTDLPTPATVDDETVQNQIKGILRVILRAEEGTRNRLLFWGACKLGKMVAADLVALGFVEMLLDDAGTRIGLPSREIRATAISGLRTALGGNHDAC